MGPFCFAISHDRSTWGVMNLGVDEVLLASDPVGQLVLRDLVGRPVGRVRGSVGWGRSPVRRWTARECPGTSTRRVPLGRSWDNGGPARLLSAAPSRRRSRSAFGPVDHALVQPAATPPRIERRRPHRRPRRRRGAVVTAAARAVPLGTVSLVIYVDPTTMNWRYPGPDEQRAWRRNFPTPSGCTGRRPGTRSTSAVGPQQDGMAHR